MWPVVAAGHPLAALPQPLEREALEPHVQLVLTDRTPLTQNLSGGIVSRHIWRFADLATRLDFLLAGFGWCNMPSHMVADHVAAGRLKKLEIANQEEIALPLYVVHERGRVPGERRPVAGRGLARADENLPRRASRRRSKARRRPPRPRAERSISCWGKRGSRVAAPVESVKLDAQRWRT